MRCWMLLLVLSLAACTPAEPPRQLHLYEWSVETRLFANSVGFEFPEGTSLEQTFERESGVLLSREEADAVSNAVRVAPPPDTITACAHFWRQVFVFYDASGSPLGALGYCMECGAVTIIGPEDPQVGVYQLIYGGEGLERIIESHDMVVPLEYAE